MKIFQINTFYEHQTPSFSKKTPIDKKTTSSNTPIHIYNYTINKQKK